MYRGRPFLPWIIRRLEHIMRSAAVDGGIRGGMNGTNSHMYEYTQHGKQTVAPFMASHYPVMQVRFARHRVTGHHPLFVWSALWGESLTKVCTEPGRKTFAVVRAVQGSTKQDEAGQSRGKPDKADTLPRENDNTTGHRCRALAAHFASSGKPSSNHQIEQEQRKCGWAGIRACVYEYIM